MAFCVNCGNEISEQAVMCPSCGHPGPNAARSLSAGELATWGSRVGAALLDMLVLAVPFLIIFFSAVQPRLDGIEVNDGVVTGVEASTASVIIMATLVFFLIAALYKPLFEGYNGQTLGKRWVNIRVIRADDGGAIGYGKAFFRWFIGAVIGSISILNIIDVLWPLWDERNQTLHDKAAKTIVVKVDPQSRAA